AKGDDVSITGYIWDGPISPTFNVTRIDSVSGLTINSQNNPLPDFKVLSTGDIGLAGNGDPTKEQWESVLIKYLNVTVTDENADGPPSNFGEMLVDDNSGETRVELEDGFHSYHNLSDPTRANYIQTGNAFDELGGLLYYSFGNYKLVPRNDNDFVGWVTDVNEENQLPEEFGLFQNHPNPFNPSTIINYNLPVQANVTLKIFNILGQEVKTLLNNEIVPAGEHQVSFNASGLPTGIYIYNLQANDFVQSKKMILLK
ncbi:MAG: T9SS type A sorting domain-containing protein, partial [Ignavibacteriaceae bacterium]|nr:T9SS type A sorting domain-containing protein [Ignavibacteriaceae bacterium]